MPAPAAKSPARAGRPLERLHSADQEATRHADGLARIRAAPVRAASRARRWRALRAGPQPRPGRGPRNPARRTASGRRKGPCRFHSDKGPLRHSPGQRGAGTPPQDRPRSPFRGRTTTQRADRRRSQSHRTPSASSATRTPQVPRATPRLHGRAWRVQRPCGPRQHRATPREHRKRSSSNEAGLRASRSPPPRIRKTAAVGSPERQFKAERAHVAVVVPFEKLEHASPVLDAQSP